MIGARDVVFGPGVVDELETLVVTIIVRSVVELINGCFGVLVETIGILVVDEPPSDLFVVGASDVVPDPADEFGNLVVVRAVVEVTNGFLDVVVEPIGIIVVEAPTSGFFDDIMTGPLVDEVIITTGPLVEVVCKDGFFVVT